MMIQTLKSRYDLNKKIYRKKEKCFEKINLNLESVFTMPVYFLFPLSP